MLGLHPDQQTLKILVLGHEWSFQDAICGRALEGHYEAGLQLMFAVFVQQQTFWPALQALLGYKTKGYYFDTSNPGTVSNFAITFNAWKNYVLEFSAWSYILMTFN